MNRAAFKSLGALLLGVALGWGIARSPERGSVSGALNNPPSGAAVQSGPAWKPASHAAPKAPAGEVGAIREAGGAPDPERREAIFRGKDKYLTTLDAVMEAATMPADEIAPLLARLAEEEMDVRALELLTVRWALLDPKAALAFALGRGDLSLSFDMMPRIVAELAKVDLPAAREALSKLERGMRTHAERAIVRVLQRRDIRAALSYARELEDEEAEADILALMAETDPMGAAAELTPGRPAQLGAVEGITVSLLARDRAVFEAWAGSLNDPAQRSVAFSTALSMDAGADPRSAALGMAAWLAKDAEASVHAGDLAAELAGKWAEDGGKPIEVAAWALSLPEGPAWNAAVAEAARQWLERDSMAASIWLRSLPQGMGKDSAVLRLVQEISGDTPADSFEWARTVENPALRADALRDAVQGWVKQDPDTAERALESLSADDRVGVRGIVEAAGEEQEREKAGTEK